MRLQPLTRRCSRANLRTHGHDRPRECPSRKPKTSLWSSSAAVVTKIIFAFWLPSRARCVAGCPVRLTIFGLHSHGHSAAECRMSSRCRCAASIIASFTARVTSAHGGTKPTSIPCRLRSDSGNTRGVFPLLHAIVDHCNHPWPRARRQSSSGSRYRASQIGRDPVFHSWSRKSGPIIRVRSRYIDTSGRACKTACASSCPWEFPPHPSNPR